MTAAFFVWGLSGCDAVYRLLHKEGAEEKEILGEVMPYESNEKVAEIQKLLKLYGYRVGKADGVLGLNTRNAVAAFQVDNELQESRFVDKATWARLHMFEESGLIVGGELNIMAVQEALKRAGMDPGPVDGKPGRRTQTAIVNFQKSCQLKADGKVGFKTLKFLAEYMLPQADAQ